MTTIHITTTLVLLALVPFAFSQPDVKYQDPTIDCPGPWQYYWKYFNGNCYRMPFSGLKTQEEAEAYCKGIGGNLASIHSAEENDFIFTNIKRTVSFYNFFWIGLNENTKKHFQWSDGTNLDFSALEKNPSKVQSEDSQCVSIYNNNNKTWQITTCDERMGLICKKPYPSQ